MSRNNSELVLELIILAVSKAEALGALYTKARAEGREVLNEELVTLSGAADASLESLQAWIDSTKPKSPAG